MNINSRIRCFQFYMVLTFILCPLCVIAAENNYIKGDSPPDSQSESLTITCYESPKYFIIAKQTRGKAGTDFLIKYKSRQDKTWSCDYTFGNNDFEIRNEWAEYFAGLNNDLLILDSTTGPGPSGLIIWDLAQRKKVYEGSWSDPEESEGNFLVYWIETGEATDDNCPELKDWRSHGLGGAIETKVMLNLSNFRITKTEERRCRPRQ